jgi:hypothetical protein
LIESNISTWVRVNGRKNKLVEIYFSGSGRYVLCQGLSKLEED